MLRLMSWPTALLLIVPVAPALGYLTDASPIWIFIAASAAVAMLADWVRRATEHVASRVGTAIGGLLNISFGSVASFPVRSTYSLSQAPRLSSMQSPLTVRRHGSKVSFLSESTSCLVWRSSSSHRRPDGPDASYLNIRTTCPRSSCVPASYPAD